MTTFPPVPVNRSTALSLATSIGSMNLTTRWDDPRMNRWDNPGSIQGRWVQVAPLLGIWTRQRINGGQLLGLGYAYYLSKHELKMGMRLHSLGIPQRIKLKGGAMDHYPIWLFLRSSPTKLYSQDSTYKGYQKWSDVSLHLHWNEVGRSDIVAYTLRRQKTQEVEVILHIRMQLLISWPSCVII